LLSDTYTCMISLGADIHSTNVPVIIDHNCVMNYC